MQESLGSISFCQSKLIKRERQLLILGLLEQQNEQRQLGMIDPKGLFHFSRAASKQSRLRAIHQAKEDARQAQEFSKEQEEEEEEDQRQTLDIIDNVLDLMDQME